VQPKRNKRNAPELFDSKQKGGGKMGGEPAFGAARDCGRFRVSLFVLVASFALISLEPAHAQDPSACTPSIARIVSLQGQVEVQRGGAGAWSSIRQLDTAICAGDRMRAGSLSRAVLFVQPETLVRLDQNTTITLRQTADETHVELHADEPKADAKDSQCCGAVYLITRFPKKFKVTTPHMNAAVEGTEFMVESSRDASKLTVLEGNVSSESVTTKDRQLVNAGQSYATGAGAGVITAIVKPEDAVQWVLLYPQISDQSESSGMSDAEKLLRAGSVDEALEAIDSELAANSSNSDAHALRSVIQVAKNDRSGALESAETATSVGEGNYRAWLALSYAQQAGFDLKAALRSAQRAKMLNTRSSLSDARVAELFLSLGDARRAEEVARAAVANNPAESHAHAILGFVHLAQMDVKAARTDFHSAIDRDSFNALPRLGLGLVMIRDGELVQGREQIEIAVCLDPSNSLLRSYVGKAYYEENSNDRNALAATQFELARQLDPQDPTPHFYSAILKYSQSRPAEALADLEASSIRNDDRAVYRSRQLLDLDMAARHASQASIYYELGLHQLGLLSAAESLALDPASGSAHRFLADIYAATPRHEISRASELLQAQLRQPLGAPSLQPQLANDVLFKDAFFGPAVVGFNEFNPLFVQDGLRIQLFGMLGDESTYGDQVIVSGLHGRTSYSLSQFASESGGYRQNSEDSVRQYDGFLQSQLGANTSLQLELTSTTRESGDLTSAFDPEYFSDIVRNDFDLDIQRFGVRQIIDSNSDLLVSLIRQDRAASSLFPDPVAPTTLMDATDTWKVEAQYQTSFARMNFVAGLGYFEGDSTFEVSNPFFGFETSFEPRHINAYGYLQLPAHAGWPTIQLGLAFDDLKLDVGDQSEFSPKLGVSWKILEVVTLRVAGFRVLKRQDNSIQGLEPTQLAGFNQFFDDTSGALSEGGGIAADFEVAKSTFVGLQYMRRNLESPVFDVEGNVVFHGRREDVASGYAYWHGDSGASVTFEPRYTDIEGGDTFDEMRLVELPLSLRYVAKSGIRFGLTATAVDQEGQFDAFGEVVPGADSFWLLDAIIGYRLPGRAGTISLEGRNLLDEEFRFQDVDVLVAPRYLPDAQVLFRFALSF
jgi:Tfp pilus assembly protein PilF